MAVEVAEDLCDRGVRDQPPRPMMTTRSAMSCISLMR